jgi:hypothetical protein
MAEVFVKSQLKKKGPGKRTFAALNIATGEVEDTTAHDRKNAEAIELGRKGGLKYGKGRARE